MRCMRVKEKLRTKRKGKNVSAIREEESSRPIIGSLIDFHNRGAKEFMEHFDPMSDFYPRFSFVAYCFIEIFFISAFITVLNETLGNIIFFGSCFIFLVLSTTRMRRSCIQEALVCIFNGAKIISLDGKWIWAPPFSELITVPLKMKQHDISCVGEHALFTQDNLRVDLRATFFIRIRHDEYVIGKVIDMFGRDAGYKETAFGSTLMSPIDKYVSYNLAHIIKSTMVQHTLAELKRDPDALAKILMSSVQKGLESRVFCADSITISLFDQSDAAILRPDNIFDAQGIITVDEAKQQLETDKHRIKSEGEFERGQRDIAMSNELLKLRTALQQSQIQHQAEITHMKATTEAVLASQQVELDSKLSLAKATADAALAEQRSELEARLALTNVALVEAQQLALNVGAKADRDRRAMYAELDLDIQMRQFEKVASAAFSLQAELEKFRIKTDADVRIESAKSMSQMMSGMNTTLYATPDDVTKMMGSFMWGATTASKIEGFTQGLSRAFAPLSPLLNAYGLMTQDVRSAEHKESEGA